MIKVRVEIAFSFRREMTPSDPIVELPEGSSVGDAFRELADQSAVFRHRVYDASYAVRRHIQALVNGVNVQHAKGLNTMLADGDRLTILPPVGGG